jgi:hypothetical protein
MPIVYKITNKTNNKSYIGLTVRTLDQRWKSHMSSVRQGSKFRFHSAIRKYGFDDWNFEILFEHEDITIIRKKEEELIEFFGLMNNKKGYNAKPGGCGGWIVPEEKYESWRKIQQEKNKGLGNGNSTKYTNEELIEIAKNICVSYGRIISHSAMVSACKEKGIRFPKTFRPMRFDGNYKNFAEILEKKLGMKYDPGYKSVEHRQKLREANLGKIGNNINTKVIIVGGKRRHVKN